MTGTMHTADHSNCYRNKGAMTPDGRPVPAPRSRPASAVPSREPSVARSSAPEYNNPSPSYDSYRGKYRAESALTRALGSFGTAVRLSR